MSCISLRSKNVHFSSAVDTHEDSAHNQRATKWWPLGRQRCFSSQTLRKRCGSARGGNSRECAEGQVSSELLMEARKKSKEKGKSESWLKLFWLKDEAQGKGPVRDTWSCQFSRPRVLLWDAGSQNNAAVTAASPWEDRGRKIKWNNWKYMRKE